MRDGILLIVGMALVTYIPRLLPLLFLKDREIPQFLKSFLKCIPYTALGALIIPGAFQSVPEKPVAAYIGIGAALVASWFNGGLIVSVLAAVGGVFIVLCL